MAGCCLGFYSSRGFDSVVGGLRKNDWVMWRWWLLFLLVGYKCICSKELSSGVFSPLLFLFLLLVQCKPSALWEIIIIHGLLIFNIVFMFLFFIFLFLVKILFILNFSFWHLFLIWLLFALFMWNYFFEKRKFNYLCHRGQHAGRKSLPPYFWLWS